MTQPAPLSALLRKESDIWVLQCLDYDIAVQGGALDELFRDFERVLNGHILLDLQAGRRPLEQMPAAPDSYWEEFRRGLKVESFRLKLVESVSAKPRPKAKTSKRAKKSMLNQMPMPWVMRSVVSEMRLAK